MPWVEILVCDFKLIAVKLEAKTQSRLPLDMKKKNETWLLLHEYEENIIFFMRSWIRGGIEEGFFFRSS